MYKIHELILLEMDFIVVIYVCLLVLPDLHLWRDLFIILLWLWSSVRRMIMIKEKVFKCMSIFDKLVDRHCDARWHIIIKLRFRF